jgi:SNF2 family DNA or RNA helicase
VVTFTGTLLPYQPEAVDRMCERGSMLVAYDLGLGKTVLTIAAIERLMDEERILEPGLVIALSSLKYQWAESIRTFSDSTPLVIDGDKKQREAQYARALNWESEGIDYVVLNYEQVVNDWDILKNLEFDAIVCDEATAIKGFRAKRAKKVKELAKIVEETKEFSEDDRAQLVENIDWLKRYYERAEKVIAEHD